VPSEEFPSDNRSAVIKKSDSTIVIRDIFGKK